VDILPAERLEQAEVICSVMEATGTIVRKVKAGEMETPKCLGPNLCDQCRQTIFTQYEGLPEQIHGTEVVSTFLPTQPGELS